MKALFIGGTGVISIACTRLAAETGMELCLLNRGRTLSDLPPGVEQIEANARDAKAVADAIRGRSFDVVANFIAYTREDVERDVHLFAGSTAHYVFISSASVYQKPLPLYRVTEQTPVGNPFWQYARDKIACEQYLATAQRDRGLAATIVRPSFTYGDTSIPLSINARVKPWSVVDRMLRGKPIIVHGDGLGLWTMTHNTDFAKGFVGLLGNPHAIGQTVHITSDEVLSWDEHYRIVGEAVGVEPQLVHLSSEFIAAWDEQRRGGLLGDKAHSAVFDNTKIKSLVPHFNATMSFRQGMQRTIAAFLEDASRRAIDQEFDRWCDAAIEAHRKAAPPPGES